MKTQLQLILLFLVFYSTSQAQTSWTRTTYPPSGTVRALTTIGTNIFAGAINGGIYFSPDSGKTWIKRNGTYSTMYVLALTNDGTNLYAGISNNLGLPGDPVILKSSDLGLTWQDITPTDLSTLIDVDALCIHGNDIYAGTFGNQKGIFKSSLTNISSSSWTSFNKGLESIIGYIEDIRSLSIIGDYILAGTYGQGVMISPLDSPDWVVTSSGMSSDADYIQALAANGSTVFAGNVSGTPTFYQSTNGGADWTSLNTVLPVYKPVYAITIRGNQTYVGFESAGDSAGAAFYSTDNGVTWVDYNDGFKDSLGHWICNHINIRSFAFIGDMIFAGTDCGVWMRQADAVITTGISDVKTDHAIRVYPNPASTYITIDNIHLSAKQNYQVNISTILGQEVFQQNISQQQNRIDILNWNKGIYFLTITNDQGSIINIQKIIVQ